jgi:hypothetical protein
MVGHPPLVEAAIYPYRTGVAWRVRVDSTIARVHQHGASAPRSVGQLTSHTGGTIEQQGIRCPPR